MGPQAKSRAIDLRAALSALAPFRGVSSWRSSMTAGGTLACFVGFWIATFLLVPHSFPLALLTAVAGGLTLSRIFVLFHDCVHYALFRTPLANRIWGTLFGLLVYTPYERWRRSHLAHHRVVGDIDQSDVGYLRLHTVATYRSWSPLRRFGYRIFRSPPILIGLLPIVHFALGHRLPSAWRNVDDGQSPWDVHITTVVLVALHWAAAWAWGAGHVALVQVPICVIAASVAGWLFFVQHHFKDAIWRKTDEGWSYSEGALHGSSYLRMHPVLDWLWVGIGYHHVHHLDSRIPCYRLKAATDEVGASLRVPGYTMRETLPFARLALWDEAQERLVPIPRGT